MVCTSKSKGIPTGQSRLLTVITVCKNAQETICETLDSFDRNAKDIAHHLIIDGGSTDLTCTHVTSASSPNRTLITIHDNGLYEAMNRGIVEANSEYILYLNADDVLVDDALEDISKTLASRKYDVLLAPTVYFSEKTTASRTWNLPDRLPPKFDASFVPPHPGFIVRRSLLRENGINFNTNFPICADMLLMLSVLSLTNIAIAMHATPLIKMRIGGISTQTTVSRRKTFEFYRIYRTLGYSPHMAIYLVTKRYLRKLPQLLN